jgi:cyanophycinase-like exopeptidase
MTDKIKPLYLLADSQLLFWNGGDNKLINAIRDSLDTKKNTYTKAAYIGASNGNAPEFFELFMAAMDNIDIHQSRMISSSFNSEDRAFLESADFILLSGGDFSVGWDILNHTGMAEIITQKYYSGSVIAGISAGAMQLGIGGYSEDKNQSIKTMQIIPYYIDVHDEKNNWLRLKTELEQTKNFNKGFGIATGGGLIYHPDVVIEPIHKTVHELYYEPSEKRVSSNMLLPL